MEWLADESNRTGVAVLRDRFEQGVLDACPGAVSNTPSDPSARVWGTSNIAFPGVQAEALVVMLSERGVCASAGAACSSGSLEPSPVLLAMGVPETLAHGSVRFSLSRFTAWEALGQAAEIVSECVTRLGRSAR
jgi:cysteine desulfurase